MSKMVHHTPKWVPGHLRIDAAGNTEPGFICVHELENGNGQCGGNVFRIEDEIGDHCCVVMENPYESGDRVYYRENGPTDQGIVVGPIVSPDHVTVIWESDNDISEHSLELIVAVKPTKRN